VTRNLENFCELNKALYSGHDKETHLVDTTFDNVLLGFVLALKNVGINDRTYISAFFPASGIIHVFHWVFLIGAIAILSLEMYHYYSPILKDAIIILSLLEKCHAIRLWEPWAQMQCMEFQVFLYGRYCPQLLPSP